MAEQKHDELLENAQEASLEPKLNIPKLAFDGSFNPIHRWWLTNFCREMGITQEHLAMMLACDSATVIKWISGDSRACQPSQYAAIQQLFNNDWNTVYQQQQQRKFHRMEMELLKIIAERKL